MSRSLGRVPEPWNWVANAALLIQFPVVHSLLLTGRAEGCCPAGAVGRRFDTVGDDLRDHCGLRGIRAVRLLVADRGDPVAGPWFGVGGDDRALRGILAVTRQVDDRRRTLLQTGALGWFALFRGRKPVYPPMPESGLFRLIRQPIYLAFTMTLWTVPTWTPDQLVVAVALTGYCLVAPRFKEARFRRIYGREFDRYAAAVPYWLPWPRPRISAAPRKGMSPAGKTIE